MGSRQLDALQAIANRGREQPEAPALISTDGSVCSYRELNRQIGLINAHLENAGLADRDRVAVLLPTGAEQLLAVTGVLSRSVCVPLQPRTTPAEVAASINDLSISALVTSAEFPVEAALAEDMGVTVIHAHAGLDTSPWTIKSGRGRKREPAAGPEEQLILITSATTAGSKVVPLSCESLNAGNAWTRDAAQLNSNDRLLQMVSLCHRMGFENAFAQFLAGGAVIATEGFDAQAFLRWLRELKPTWYCCAPAVHRAVLESLPQSGAVEHSLRLLQSAGAALSIDVRQALEDRLRVPCLNGYGATEAHYIAIEQIPFEGHIPGAAGRSCGLEIGILGGDGLLLPPGKNGEIVTRGPSLFSGYLNDPEATAQAFHEGWFRTGDAGNLDADGNLFVTGRLKEMINRGGEKIAPTEVDAAFRAHPAILHAASFPLPHPTLGEDIACAIVLRPEAHDTVGTAALRQFVAQSLAAFKVPRRIFFVDQIPAGELGKPQRWLLTEQFRTVKAQTPTPQDVTYRRSVYDVDEVFYKIYEIWSRLLNRDDLGFDEDFFEAGGDSLTALNMLAEVDQRLGSHTSSYAAQFLDEPTIAQLMSLVGRPSFPRSTEASSGAMQLYPITENGAGHRIFCVPGDEEEGLMFRRLAAHLSGTMDVAVVRPANTFHSRELYTIEHAAQQMAEIVLREHCAQPVFLCGFCYGGIVAAAAAQRLQAEGVDVRLVLLDTPMPGCPSLPTSIWDQIARFVRKRLSAAQRHASPDGVTERSSYSLRPQARGPWRNALTRVARRASWSAVRVLRRILAPMQKHPAMARFLAWAQKDDLPFHRPRVLTMPVLHFIATVDPDTFTPKSRYGWRKLARRLTEKQLPLDHSNVLHESNLPEVVHTLLAWSGLTHQDGASGSYRSNSR